MLPVTLLALVFTFTFALEIAIVLFGIPLLIMNAMGSAVGRALRRAKVWDKARSGGSGMRAVGSAGSRVAGVAGWLLGAYAGIYVVGLLALCVAVGLILLTASQTSL